METKKVGYIYEKFHYAAELIDQGTYRWVIVERPQGDRIIWNVMLPTEDSSYLSRLGWQNFWLQGFPGKDCYYHNPNRTFKDVISGFGRLTEIDFKVELTLVLEDDLFVVRGTLNRGVLLVFLESPSVRQGKKNYHLFTRSPTMTRLLDHIYPRSTIAGISDTCYDIGTRDFQDFKQEILKALEDSR